MSCENCPNLQDSISDCPPFANRNDVIALFQNIQNACCVGVVEVNTESPASSNQAALDASLEAFPDGFDTCYCPCKFIVDEDNDRLYVNCTDDLNTALNWHDVSEACMSNLTTIGLDPESNPAASTNEGWPLGLSVHCETAILFTENGTTCFSRNAGVTWDCVGNGRDLAIIQNTFTVERTCSGANGANPCCAATTGNQTVSMRLFNPNVSGQIALAGNNNENGDVINNCIICPRGATIDFKVSLNGLYRFFIDISYVGNFALGNSGCAGCSFTGTTDGELRLVNTAGTILYTWQLNGNSGTSNKESERHIIEAHVNLLSAQEYAFILQINRLPTSCCTCSPTYDVRGTGKINLFSIQFID